MTLSKISGLNKPYHWRQWNVLWGCVGMGRFVNRCVILICLICLILPGNALAETRTGTLRLLVLGDSLTSGHGLPAAQSFPNQLEAVLRARGHKLRVINGGVSGDTSAGGLARLDWTMMENPHGVIVELGANDGFRGMKPRTIRKNISAILDRLRSRKTPAMVVGMKAPRNMGKSYVQEFDRLYPSLAKEYGVVFYPFFLEGVALVPALNQKDGIHPNASGVAHIVRGILPMVETLLKQMKAASISQN
jgi:acyl-CoA thioesterase I